MQEIFADSVINAVVHELKKNGMSCQVECSWKFLSGDFRHYFLICGCKAAQQKIKAVFSAALSKKDQRK